MISATAPEAFTGVSINYLPGTPADQMYSPSTAAESETYFESIVQPDVLQEILVPDSEAGPNFTRIDGALVINEDGPVVQNVSSDAGRDSFIEVFRRMISRQTMPDGEITGTWIPKEVYQATIGRLVTDALRRQGLPPIAGHLLTAAVVSFPYGLRPVDQGGEPLSLPPPLHGSLTPGEKPFEPLVATGDPNLDRLRVNVIQALYVDDRGVTARVGLVLDDPTGRAVPFAINDQILAARSGESRPEFDTGAIVQSLIDYNYEQNT